MKKIIIGAAAICSVLMSASCEKKDNKKTDESINITVIETSVPKSVGTICEHQEDNVLVVTSGETLSIQYKLHSGVGLAQYKIEVHNNFDCHGHDNPPSLTWEVNKIVELSGKDTTLTDVITIPEDAKSGNYHYMIRLIDVLGNEAEFVEFNISVKNKLDSIAPTITITDPIADTIVLNRGGAINIKTLVADNLNLKSGHFEAEWINALGQESHLDSWSTNFLNQDNVSLPIENTLNIAQDEPLGFGKLILIAQDYYNNKGIKEVVIHIAN